MIPAAPRRPRRDPPHVRKSRIIDYVGELHLGLLLRLRTLPVMIPVVDGVPAASCRNTWKK